MKSAMVVMVALMAAIVPSLGLAASGRVLSDHEVRSVFDDLCRATGKKFTLQIEEKEDFNAHSSGERIGLNRGAIKACVGHQLTLSNGQAMWIRPEDEIAGLLAHEVKHSKKKHGFWGALAQIVGAGIGNAVGRKIGVDTQTSQQVGAVLVGSAASHKYEDSADRSAELVLKAGYNPYGLLSVFNIIEGLYGGAGGISHPATDKRFRRVEGAIAKMTGRSGNPALDQPIGVVGARPSNLGGGVAVIVRDNARGGGGFWAGWNSSEEAVKTTMENALEQTGYFTVVDRSGREESWEEQDLPKDRMDPTTMPQKGKTHGAKYFLYITLNYYQVTEEGTARIGRWDKRAEAKRIKAEIRGKVKLEPTEKSVVAYSTEFRGSEVGYDGEASSSRGWRSGIDVSWSSRPAGKAVEAACRKVATDLASYVESQTRRLSAKPADDEAASGPVVTPEPAVETKPEKVRLRRPR